MTAKPVLYYLPGSAPVRTVLLVARAIDLQLDLKFVDFAAGEHLQPWFVALNPQHTVPTLLDTDGRVLWDSHAIATYLIGKYGGQDDHPLYPRDLYTRARIDQRLMFDAAVFFPIVYSVMDGIIWGGEWQPTEKQLKGAHESYATLEVFLANDAYLVGDQLTVADLALITTVTQMDSQVRLDGQRYPRLAAWVQRLAALPYFEEVNNGNLAPWVRQLAGFKERNRVAAEAEAAPKAKRDEK